MNPRNLRTIASALRRIADALDDEADTLDDEADTLGEPTKPKVQKARRKRGPIQPRLSAEDQAKLDAMPQERRDALDEQVEEMLARKGFVLTPKGERARDARHARMRAREEAARKQQVAGPPKQTKRKPNAPDE